MRLRWIGPVLLACALSSPACASAPKDAEFEAAWVEDFENDRASDVAEEAEQAQLDQLDDEDDLSTLFNPTGSPEPTGDAPSALAKSLRPKGGAATPKPYHGPISILQDVNWFDPQTALGAEAKRTIAEARLGDVRRDLGVRLVRTVVSFRAVAPDPSSLKRPVAEDALSNPSTYDFSGIEAQLLAARRLGMQVLLTVSADDLPYWASEDPQTCRSRAEGVEARCSYRPSPKRFAQFVHAVARLAKSHRAVVWGWTVTQEPTASKLRPVDSEVDEDAMAAAFRYRQLWFHTRRHVRAVMGPQRVLFGDFTLAAAGSRLPPSSPKWNLVPWSLCLDTSWKPDLVDGKYKCPESPRKVHAQGFAFRAYGESPAAIAKTVSYLQRSLDHASDSKRLSNARGIYLTEGGFPTSTRYAVAVPEDRQGVVLNQAEHALAINKRIKSVAQVQLLDDAYGVWDGGLLHATGRVLKKDGTTVTGELLEVVRGAHVTVKVADGTSVVVAWSDVLEMAPGLPLVLRDGAGSAKPAYAAYRIAATARRSGDRVTIWSHARANTGAEATVEAFIPSAEGGSWQPLGKIAADTQGYGQQEFPVAGAAKWRVGFGEQWSRDLAGDDPAPPSWGGPGGTLDDDLVGPELFGINAPGGYGNFSGLPVSYRDGATGPALAPLPDRFFGAVRWWDAVPTKWCDIQPTADANVEANLIAMLDPQLDAAARAGVKRVVMVLGHGRAWTFDSTSTATNVAQVWYCANDPISQAIAAPGASGEVMRARFAEYVKKFLDHLSRKYGKNMPFELDLQTWNEPTAGSLRSEVQAMIGVNAKGEPIFAKLSVPHAATTPEAASRSLAQFDEIVREQIEANAALDRRNVKLFVSPITRWATGGFPAAYLDAANARHRAWIADKKRPLYDGFSLQVYSLQSKDADGKKAPQTADELIAEYNCDARDAGCRGIDAIFGALASRYEALASLPRFQTETNHGFAPAAADKAKNGLGRYPLAERSKLMARLLTDALALGLDGQFLYSIGPDQQYPIMLQDKGDGGGARLTTDDSFQTLLRVRGWIVGSKFEGCRTVGGVVDCLIRPPPFDKYAHLVFTRRASKAKFDVPLRVTTAEPADGEPSKSVKPGEPYEGGITTLPVLFR